MEHTSCERKCPFVKMGLCNSVEECPNHMETWWKEGESGQSKLVRDCVPKRLMLQMAHLQLRMECAQSASEEARNESHAVKEQFSILLKESRKYLEEQADKPSLLCLKDKNKDDS